MSRDPSIHVTKSQYIKILRDIGFGHYESVSMADEFFYRAKPYSVHTRTILISNDRVEKKAKKLMNSSRADADLFARLIYTRRRLMKHRGISQITPGGKDWETVKEVTGHALEFSKEYNIPRRKAFILYVDIGLTKMKKFMLNKYLGMYEGICETYQASLEIQLDPDPFMTEQMYTFYNQYVVSQTGIFSDLKSMPERYVFFVRARKQAKELNISVKVYMAAQFAELDFTKTIPHPSQMIGVKARERVVRYCYKEGIVVKQIESDSD